MFFPAYLKSLTLRLTEGGAIRTLLAAIAFCSLCAIFLMSGIRLMEQFPTSYTWSELLINYQGGFVRRGLLGQAAYALDPLVSAKFTITFAIFIALLVSLIRFVPLAFRAGIFIGFLFLVSPAGFLFPTYDFEVFGRKDVFIVAALAASTLLIEKASRNHAFVAIAIIYLLTGLVVETAWLYFFIAVSILTAYHGDKAPRDWHVKVWAIALLYLGACIGWMYAVNHDLPNIGVISEQQLAITHSWKAIYPTAYGDRDAVTWLGWPLKQGITMAFDHQKYARTLAGYAIGFALALVPAILVAVQYGRREATAIVRVPAIGAFLVMASTFAIGADWGRYIHLFTLHCFVFLIMTRKPVVEAATKSRMVLVSGAVLVFLYALTWKLSHFVSGGACPLTPGQLFSWLGYSS